MFTLSGLKEAGVRLSERRFEAGEAISPPAGTPTATSTT